MLFDAISYLSDREPHDAALNMAIDEMLLQGAGGPILRVYRWARPSVSFGYFGIVSEVEAAWPERELVRRWTGGGVVTHGEDFTYTLIVPRGHPFARERALESYAAIHEIVAALVPGCSESGAMLAPVAAPKVSNACFENPAQHDVLIGEEKVAGAAQRRTKWGLLHQGSIQIASLPADFGAALAAALAAEVVETRMEPKLLASAAELAGRKYGTREWLRRF